MTSGIKITGLPFAFAASLSDILPEVQGGITKQVNLNQILNLYNANIQITESQVTNLVSDLASKLNLSGGTMTGAISMSNNQINNLANPTLPQDAATKSYADSIAGGFTPIAGTQAATVSNLNATYNNGASGVGATLTNAGAQVAFIVDGYAANLNDRILVKNQTAQADNGIYTVTTVGTVSTNWVLTRATDFDTPSKIKPGDFVPVANGTVNAGSSWLETATVTTIGTDPIQFSAFFMPAQFLQKANNLSDLANIATALVNLGLGTPTGTGNVVLQNSPSILTPSLTGVTDGSNASSGIIGESISSIIPFASSITLTNSVVANVTSISLGAGDWDIFGNVNFNMTGGGAPILLAWASTTSATQPDSSLFNSLWNANNFSGDNGIQVPYLRVSSASPSTVYLSCLTNVSTGTVKACGGIYARRVR